jgi:hypothetical protein
VILVGPMAADPRWQAREGTGCDQSAFTIDWEPHAATCPQGKQRRKWQPEKAVAGQEQTLRSSSQPLQAWECMRASLETELALQFVKAELPIGPLPLQHTKGDEAAREMVPLRPF